MKIRMALRLVKYLAIWFFSGFLAGMAIGTLKWLILEGVRMPPRMTIEIAILLSSEYGAAMLGVGIVILIRARRMARNSGASHNAKPATEAGPMELNRR